MSWQHWTLTAHSNILDCPGRKHPLHPFFLGYYRYVAIILVTRLCRLVMDSKVCQLFSSSNLLISVLLNATANSTADLGVILAEGRGPWTRGPEPRSSLVVCIKGRNTFISLIKERVHIGHNAMNLCQNQRRDEITKHSWRTSPLSPRICRVERRSQQQG